MTRRAKKVEDVREKFIQAIRLGATIEIACNYSGMSHDLYHEWVKLAESGKKPYADFIDDVKEAFGARAVGWMAKIEKAASEGTWQAAAWKLERTLPKDYGRTMIDVNQKITHEDIKSMSDDELQKIIKSES